MPRGWSGVGGWRRREEQVRRQVANAHVRNFRVLRPNPTLTCTLAKELCRLSPSCEPLYTGACVSRLVQNKANQCTCAIPSSTSKPNGTSMLNKPPRLRTLHALPHDGFCLPACTCLQNGLGALVQVRLGQCSFVLPFLHLHACHQLGIQIFV